MALQLTLKGLTLKKNATFTNFYSAQNTHLMSLLPKFAEKHGEPFIYIWGPESCGKSHLLQAVCHAAYDAKLQSFYLPLKEVKVTSPLILDNLEQLDIICIDDIDCISGDKAWEEALFDLYNRLREANTYLLVSSQYRPNELSLTLPDLISRLSAGVIFHMPSLADEEKIQALQLNANARGFKLSNEVGHFLLRRCSRNMTNLFNVLDILDEASLVAQRRLTVPFVKRVLAL